MNIFYQTCQECNYQFLGLEFFACNPPKYTCPHCWKVFSEEKQLVISSYAGGVRNSFDKYREEVYKCVSY